MAFDIIVCLVSVQTEIPVSNLGNIINARNSIGADFCTDRGSAPENIHFATTDGDGFNGVYVPDPSALQTLVDSNSKGTYDGNVTEGNDVRKTRRRLLAITTINSGNFSGIRNPVVCLRYGETMMWQITKDHYPVYDRYAQQYAPIFLSENNNKKKHFNLLLALMVMLLIATTKCFLWIFTSCT